jgi:hypothetical protein
LIDHLLRDGNNSGMAIWKQKQMVTYNLSRHILVCNKKNSRNS